MKRKRRNQFEQLLLSYVPLCYAVAFRLTTDRELARRLTLDALAKAWDLREQPEAHQTMKPRLLAMIRKSFSHGELKNGPVPARVSTLVAPTLRLLPKR